MTALETKAISYLPSRLADAVIRTSSLWNGDIHEIRLRENQFLSITEKGKNINCELICTHDELYTHFQNSAGTLYTPIPTPSVTGASPPTAESVQEYAAMRF